MSSNDQFYVYAPTSGYTYQTAYRDSLPTNNTQVTREQILEYLKLKQLKADEYAPAKTEEQPMSTGKKVAIAAGIATAFAIVGDILFCKGKHIDDLIKVFKKGGTDTVQDGLKGLKNIPDEFTNLFRGLKGKTGQEYADATFDNLIKHMNLEEVAPKKFSIEGADKVCVTGGYNPVTNSISFTPGFLKVGKEEQAKLLAHELKHCQQFSNVLRTEGITPELYARAIAESNVRQALKQPMGNFMFKAGYEKAVAKGAGEEFIRNAIEEGTKKILPQITENFDHVLKLPKIKADSPEGIKALEHFEALKKYEGLDFLGMGSDAYKTNPIEVEAYAFGDEIEALFEKYLA